MSDNFPPDATPEQKGMPGSFGSMRERAIDRDCREYQFMRRLADEFSALPIDVTPTDEANISRNARTYGG
jgi:hypothetical protein